MKLETILVRIIMAIIIGGFIGYEREMRNRPAGFITHTLVCVGACVVSLIQIQMVENTILIIESNPIMASALKADIGRVVAQVITGVGFLGAGTIIFDKGSVKGLTTATTLWVVACIGLAIGLGYYQIATISGVGVIFIIVVLKRAEVIIKNKKFLINIEIVYLSKNENFIEDIVKIFNKNKFKVRDIKIVSSKNENIKECRFILYSSNAKNSNSLINKISMNDSIISLRVDN